MIIDFDTSIVEYPEHPTRAGGRLERLECRTFMNPKNPVPALRIRSKPPQIQGGGDWSVRESKLDTRRPNESIEATLRSGRIRSRSSQLALGNKDEALRLLEKSYDDLAPFDTGVFGSITIDRRLDGLRGDPRFDALARKGDERVRR